MIRVVIAEDHDLVRQGIKSLIETRHQIQVVGEACNGHEAVERTQDLLPDVLLLDLNMPLMNGMDTIKHLRHNGQSVRILILTMYCDDALVKKAFQNGANGYLLKKSNTDDLINAINQVYHGEYYLSPEIRVSFSIEEILASRGELDASEQLTARERVVCQLIVNGRTNQAIANELHISIKTVEKHRANLMEKLGVQDVAGLIKTAIKKAIIILEK